MVSLRPMTSWGRGHAKLMSPPQTIENIKNKMYPQGRALNINGFHLFILIHLVMKKEIDARTYTHKRN